MGTTGAPWNIPYVEPTDLVRDYPAADEAMAEAVAAGLTAAGNAGIGSNVVQTVATDPLAISISGTDYSAVAALSATITPTSDTSLVYVLLSIGKWATNVDANSTLRLVRGSTAIAVPPTAGSRAIGTVAGFVRSADIGPNFQFVDTPATSLAVTYSVEVSSDGGGTIFVNRGRDDGDAFSRGRTISTLTLIEVAA